MATAASIELEETVAARPTEPDPAQVPPLRVLVAVTFRAAVDDPGRFRTAKAVGAHFGLTPKRYQS